METVNLENTCQIKTQKNLKHLWPCRREQEPCVLFLNSNSWFTSLWITPTPKHFSLSQVSPSLKQNYCVRFFRDAISIKCGHFYSMGWHCLTHLTTNLSASNTVWGPPAWNPGERVGLCVCVYFFRERFLLLCCKVSAYTYIDANKYTYIYKLNL